MSKYSFGGMLKVTNDQYARLLAGETITLTDGTPITYKQNILYIVENATDQIDSQLKTITTITNADYMIPLTDKTYAQNGYTNLYLPYMAGNYKATFNPASGNLSAYKLTSTSGIITAGGIDLSVDSIILKNNEQTIDSHKIFTGIPSDTSNKSQITVQRPTEASIKFKSVDKDLMYTIGTSTNGQNGFGIYNHNTNRNDLFVAKDGSIYFYTLGWKLTTNTAKDLIFTKI